MSMLPLSVPKSLKQGFKQFLSLSDSNRSRVVDLLIGTDIVEDIDAVADEVAKHIDVAEVERVHSLVRFVASVFGVADNFPESSEEEIANAIIKGAEPDLIPNDKDPSDFIPDLVRLLKSKSASLGIYTRAMELATEVPALLLQTTVNVELRPVFSGAKQTEPNRSSLVHVMKVTYRAEQTLKEIHLTMDSDDVKTLRSQLDVSILRERRLREVLGTSPIRPMGM